MKKKLKLKVTIEYETENCKLIDEVQLKEDVEGLLTDYLENIHRDRWNHVIDHRITVEDYESKTV